MTGTKHIAVIASFLMLFSLLLLSSSLVVFNVQAVSAPTVVTNSTTGVEETNATLHGYLSDDGGESCTARFEYGLTTGYGTNTTNQTKTTGSEFNQNAVSLTEGTHYHYRAVANNSERITTWDNYTTHTSGEGMWGTSTIRLAEKYTSFSGIPLSVDFYIGVEGTPTGNCYAKVRYVGNDTVVTNCNTSKDASTISSQDWYTFAFTNASNIASEDIYVTIEYYSGNATNHIAVYHGNEDTRASYYDNSGSWIAYSVTLSIRFKYNDTSIPPPIRYGSDATFLTKPLVPTSFTATAYNTTQINLAWVKGAGADNTVIERNTSGVTSWARGVGTEIYNNTGTSYSDTDRNPSTLYYYQAWSYVTDSGLHQYSDANASSNNLTKPLVPTSFTATAYNTTQINLAWVKGTGADRTIIERNSISSWARGVGTEIYNNTGTSYSNTGRTPGTLYYYQAWSYVTDGGVHQYSSSYDSDSNYTYPTNPTNLNAHNPSYNSIDLSWTRGTGGDTTIIRGQIDSYPATYGSGASIYSGVLTSTTHSGLTEGDNWFYRAWALDSDSGYYSTGYSQDEETVLEYPSVTTGSASDVGTTNATVQGTLVNMGTAGSVDVYFEYGVSVFFGSTTTSQALVATGTFSANIINLLPDKVYYYRAVADGDGITNGTTDYFQTGTTPPTIELSNATSVTYSGAVLNANLTDIGTASAVIVTFEYGTTEAYGEESSVDIRTATGAFSISISALTESTKYYFRVKAVGDGTSYGDGRNFTTPSEPASPGGGAGGGGLPSIPSQVTTVTLTVYVEDQYGRPLQNAFVIIFQPTDTSALGITVAEELGATVAYEYTDAEGIAIFELDTGTYIVQIERQGYESETRTISLLTDMPLSDIQLNPTSVSVFGIASWMIMLSFGIVIFIISFMFRKKLEISGWGKPRNLFGASKPGSWTFSEKTTRTVLFGIAGTLLVILIIFIIPNVPALEQMAIYYVLIGAISLFAIVIESINPKFGIATIGFGKVSAVAGNILLGLAFASIFIGLTGFISQFQLLDIPLLSTESLIMILMVAGVASFFEEIFFAGVLTPTIAEKLGIVSSIVLVSVVFMFGHGLTYGWAMIPLINALVFRAGATVLTLHRKSWLSPLVAHTFINFLSILAFMMVV